MQIPSFMLNEPRYSAPKIPARPENQTVTLLAILQPDLGIPDAAVALTFLTALLFPEMKLCRVLVQAEARVCYSAKRSVFPLFCLWSLRGSDEENGSEAPVVHWWFVELYLYMKMNDYE